MPQTFQVLRCFKCSMFQIHQTKKSNKWVCKLCSEKQSIKRHYGIGTGKDCRIHVQKLNKMQVENCKIPKFMLETDDSDDSNETSTQVVRPETCKKSKWSDYLNETEEPTEIDEPSQLHDHAYVLEKPKKGKRLKRSFSKFTEEKEKVETENYFKPKNYSNIISETDFTKSNKKISLEKFVAPLRPLQPAMNAKTFGDTMSECNINNDNYDRSNVLATCHKNNSVNINTNPQKNLESVATEYHTPGHSKKISNKSKWAQYLDNEEYTGGPCQSETNLKLEHSDCNESKLSDNLNIDIGQTIYNADRQIINSKISNCDALNRNHQSSFSLVEEDDLDTILDI